MDESGEGQEYEGEGGTKLSTMTKVTRSGGERGRERVGRAGGRTFPGHSLGRTSFARFLRDMKSSNRETFIIIMN